MHLVRRGKELNNINHLLIRTRTYGYIAVIIERMSFSEDVVLSKFSTLNETQDSIVSVAQWVRLHDD